MNKCPRVLLVFYFWMDLWRFNAQCWFNMNHSDMIPRVLNILSRAMNVERQIGFDETFHKKPMRKESVHKTPWETHEKTSFLRNAMFQWHMAIKWSRKHLKRRPSEKTRSGTVLCFKVWCLGFCCPNPPTLLASSGWWHSALPYTIYLIPYTLLP